MALALALPSEHGATRRRSHSRSHAQSHRSPPTEVPLAQLGTHWGRLQLTRLDQPGSCHRWHCHTTTAHCHVATATTAACTTGRPQAQLQRGQALCCFSAPPIQGFGHPGQQPHHRRQRCHQASARGHWYCHCGCCHLHLHTPLAYDASCCYHQSREYEYQHCCCGCTQQTALCSDCRGRPRNPLAMVWCNPRNGAPS